MKFESFSVDDTKKIAEKFYSFAKPGQCFALYGDLGFGKTTFSKFLIQKISPKIQEVTSPTFTIIQTYPHIDCEILHVDCYRLKSKDEFYELGLDEALNTSITIIEWPEIIHDLLPSSTIDIVFQKQIDKIIISSNI